MNKLLYINIVSVFLFCSVAFSMGGTDAQYRLNFIQKEMTSTGDYEKALEQIYLLKKELGDIPGMFIAQGFAEYGEMKYSEAEKSFRKALSNQADGKTREMLETILTLISENRPVLSAIENADQELSELSGKEKENIIDRLNAAHIVVLNSQLGTGKYYLYTVIPHLLWLRDNFEGMDDIYEVLGDVYYSSYFYSDAADNFFNALRADPGNSQICKKLADSFVGAGDFKSARKYYDVLINIYKNSDIKDNKERIKKTQDIKQALPESYEDISILIENKQFTRAEKLARQRISISSGDYVAITQLGRIYWQKGEKRKAVKMFRKASRIAPEYPTAHLFLGKAYFFERKPDKGIKEFGIFKQKMEQLPDMDKETIRKYIQDLHYICYMYYTQRKYEKAMDECREILSMDPRNQRAHYNLAVCYYVYKHSRVKAYGELRKVLEIDDTTGDADMARYYIDYMRRNPDSRIMGDFSFIYEE